MILDLERNGWRLISTIKCKKSRHILLSFDGVRRESGLGAAAWILSSRDECGTFEKVSFGGRVLRNASAMIAEREALRMCIEHLTVLFPTAVGSFDFQVECTDRTVQYKLNAQSLRLFGLHRDVNDAHRAGANRLKNKTFVGSFVGSFLFVRFCLFVFVCSFLFVRFCLFVFVCSFLFVRFCLFVFVCSFLFVRFCLFVFVCSFLFVRFCLFVFVCSFLCVRFCVFVFVCSFLCVRFSLPFFIVFFVVSSHCFVIFCFCFVIFVIF